MAWAYAGLMHKDSTDVNSCVQLPCYIQIPNSHPLPWALKIIQPLSAVIPQSWEETIWYRCHVQGWEFQSLILYTLASCRSLLIVIYLKKKLLWRGLRDAIIYGYNDKSFGGNLILCPLSRIIVVGCLQVYDLSKYRFSALITVSGMDFNLYRRL